MFRDLKSLDRKVVPVQVWPGAPGSKLQINKNQCGRGFTALRYFAQELPSRHYSVAPEREEKTKNDT